MALFRDKTRIPVAAEALPGREDSMPVAASHFVLKTPMTRPFPEGSELAMFGLGCF